MVIPRNPPYKPFGKTTRIALKIELDTLTESTVVEFFNMPSSKLAPDPCTRLLDLLKMTNERDV